ncbi:MAG: F0F1 ATP synthase subunit A [Bacteroidales bacterium]|nr:F0F1 ATP synthase subunit A [Clostridium sp.]MCM1203386.1 F0F1 ATP synthase subunit A [Bacteroidales bacterium]
MGYGMMPMLLAADTEVDFSIHHLLAYKFMGQTVYITTSHVCMFIIMVTIMIFALVARKKIMHAKEIPTGFQNVVEFAVETLQGFVHSSMGQHGRKYMNYVGTLFLFILLSNISGLFGLRPPTADYGTTFSLALITFVMIQYNNVKYNHLGAITDLFQPIWFLFPINLIGEIATPVSMSLRLFGNVMAGTVMMALYYGLLPIFAKLGIPAALHVYFDLFSGAIQAYVFAMLTMVFVTQKIEG